MALRLLNKVAIVTGSSDGIGYSIAEKFLKEGSKVVICSRKSKNVNYAVEKLKQNCNPNNLRGVVCHVGEIEARKKLISETVETFGRIDVLVSNAATNIHFGPIMECTEDKWDKMFHTNLKSAFFLIQEALPHFNTNGSIIINSSISGLNPFPMLGIYSITKTALIGMVKVLSQELASDPLKIRVNGIAPGIIKTKFSRAIFENETLHEEFMKQLHLKRLGTGGDCAGLAAFLASDDAGYITGETIVVAGGLSTRL